MKISILGCGWLGIPLAKQLIADGHSVKGSTTTMEKLSTLETLRVDPYVIALGSGQTVDITAFLVGSEILIIDIPPQTRRPGAVRFPDKITELLPFIVRSSISKVLFVSSTSVYADDNQIVTEETLQNPQTDSGIQLLEAEAILVRSKQFATTIVRFAGLIGPGRHPITSLSGKILSNPNAPINLIHLDDCIGIIRAILTNGKWGEVYNAAYPDHPNRIDYYSRKAIEYRLPTPVPADGESVGKCISSEKLQLFYEFTTGI